MSAVKVVDLFCGAGGESTGIVRACEDLGLELDLLGVNHWDMAVDTHHRNHPQLRRPLLADVDDVKPRVAVPSGRLNLLWASPECTHHSNAAGGRPRNDQSRSGAWVVLTWLTELYVDRLIIENVPEFRHWGPLGADDKPLKSKKGETFNAFIKAIEDLGYHVEYEVLTASNYGDPTSRKRLFIQAVRGRNKIKWPEPTHADSPRVTRDILDFSIESPSIFTRKRPLKDKTLARIEKGIERYWGEWAEPFLIILRGTSTTRSLDLPVPTLTAGGGHLALIEPFLLHQMSGGKPRSMNMPVPTVTTVSGHSLVEPFLLKYYGTGGYGVMRKPLDTVTTRDTFALVEGRAGLDIGFRMLQPRELARAQGFPDDYVFGGNKGQQVKQIGNAVPVNLARALTTAALSA